MRIGIVGAENSHCAHIAKSLNVEGSLPGCEVTHVWGETPEFAAKAAAGHSLLSFDEMYVGGIRLFCGMFESKEEPLPPASYLRPIGILEAMRESLQTGAAVAVKRVPEL